MPRMPWPMRMLDPRDFKLIDLFSVGQNPKLTLSGVEKGIEIVYQLHSEIMPMHAAMTAVTNGRPHITVGDDTNHSIAEIQKRILEYAENAITPQEYFIIDSMSYLEDAEKAWLSPLDRHGIFKSETVNTCKLAELNNHGAEVFASSLFKMLNLTEKDGVSKPVKITKTKSRKR